MRYNRKNPLRKMIITGISFLILFEVISFFSGVVVTNNTRLDLQKKSYAIQNEIEKVFLNVFTITDAYHSYMIDHPDSTREETEDFLVHLMIHEENYVRNIAYVEDTIIKYNYPYLENISSIGVDLAEVEGQSEVIRIVKENKEAYFLGPVELVQGGTAFILRIPIIVDDEYVGHIATVIDADQFTDLLELTASQLEISLYLDYQDGDNYISVGEHHEGYKVKSVIENIYINWEISIYENTHLSDTFYIQWAVRLIGLLLAIITCYYVYRNTNLLNQIIHRAHHDSLTDDFNRSRFIEDFNNGLHKDKLIVFSDINKFKVLNDTLGHHFGDWALVQVSNEFKRSGKFIVYRNSGDEFILVSKEPMTKDEFFDIRNDFNLSYYNDELLRHLDMELSMGVIEHVNESIDIHDMLVYLDYAMYDSKKNNIPIKIVDDELLEVYKEQKQIEELLIEDIKKGNLISYYQPIINIKEKRVESLEVLSRWIYKDKVLSAATFIDVAKKIRYIEKMDMNLFEDLQIQYKKFIKDVKNMDQISFAVNISAETLKLFEQEPTSFDSFVSRNIIPKNNLVFEISEDINLGIISDETINNIIEQGYSVVIDDFGSGVSKLTDVLSGALYAIKTDKGMLPKDAKDSKKLKGFNTIITAINATGSNVVVEGVETIDQLSICLAAGCNTLQGYFFCRPMSYEDVVKYINDFDYDEFIKNQS